MDEQEDNLDEDVKRRYPDRSKVLNDSDSIHPAFYVASIEVSN